MTNCIVWTGAKDYDGYGIITRNGKTYSRHRWEYMQYYGNIPKGMVVMHTCDNPACYNINHLKLGTQADNMRDAHKKERNPRYRLKKDDVIEIRKLYPSITQKELAESYNVHPNTIYQVVNRITWNHI